MPALPGEDLLIGGVSIRSQELWMLGALVGSLAAASSSSTRKRNGARHCGRVPNNPWRPESVGISPVMASMVAFGIAGLVGAVAGVVYSPIYLTIWSVVSSSGSRASSRPCFGGSCSSFRAAIRRRPSARDARILRLRLHRVRAA